MRRHLLACLLLTPLLSSVCVSAYAQQNASELEIKIQELYVGILGRAADRTGLDYWADQIEVGVFTLENTRAAFTDPAQTEYTEIYGGLDNAQLVTAIYENLLERSPDPVGFQYWVDELDNGRINPDQMINAVINAVQDPQATGDESAKDLAVLENKISAAIYFTQQTTYCPFSNGFREAARAVEMDVNQEADTLAASFELTNAYSATPDCGFLAGSSGEASDNEDLVLEAEGARLEIPAGAFPPGTTVSLVAIDPEVLGDELLSNTTRFFSPIFRITFSESVIANGGFTLALDAGSATGEGLYAYARDMGGLSTENVVDTPWSLAFGELDETKTALIVPFFATANLLEIVGVERVNDPQLGMEDIKDFGRGLLAKVLSVIKGIEVFPKSYAGDAGVHTGPSMLNLFPWAVVCDPKDFGDSAGPCEPDSPEMKRIAQALTQASQSLFSRGFTSANLQVATLDALDSTRLPYAVHGGQKEGKVFLAHMTPNRPAPVYWPAQGQIQIPPGLEPLLLDRVAIHEVFHSFQAPFLLRGLWEEHWIREGTAVAVEPWVTGESGSEYRRDGQWRDWKYPLETPIENDSGNEMIPYYTGEFWLSVDPDPVYLVSFFEHLTSPGLDYYYYADNGLQSAQQPALAEAYRNLIDARHGDPTYEESACQKIELLVENLSPINLRQKLTAPSKIWKLFGQDPLSAPCFDVKFKPSPSLNCPVLGMDLEFFGNEDANVFFVDQAEYTVGDTASLLAGEERTKIWVVNTSLDIAANPEIAATPSCGGETLTVFRLARAQIAPPVGLPTTSTETFVSTKTPFSSKTLQYDSFITVIANSDEGIYGPTICKLGKTLWVPKSMHSRSIKIVDVPSCTGTASEEWLFHFQLTAAGMLTVSQTDIDLVESTCPLGPWDKQKTSISQRSSSSASLSLNDGSGAATVSYSGLNKGERINVNFTEFNETTREISGSGFWAGQDDYVPSSPVIYLSKIGTEPYLPGDEIPAYCSNPLD